MFLTESKEIDCCCGKIVKIRELSQSANAGSEENLFSTENVKMYVITYNYDKEMMTRRCDFVSEAKQSSTECCENSK